MPLLQSRTEVSLRVGVVVKFDHAPDITTNQSIELAIGTIINWQNERYRKFGLWKRYALHNIKFQQLRMKAGEISEAEFEELKKMFLAAQSEPVR